MYDSKTDNTQGARHYRCLGCPYCGPRTYPPARVMIAEGLAEYHAEREEALLGAMSESERELVLHGRDRAMEAEEAAYDAWWDEYTTGDRLPAKRVMIQADIDLEERAFRRDEVIHFAGLSRKRRAAKRRSVLVGETFDPSRVSKTLSPQFVA